MRRSIFGILALLAALIVPAAPAQARFGAEIYSNGQWIPAPSTSTLNPLAALEPIHIYCYGAANAWVPADASCFGGGGASGSLVFNVATYGAKGDAKYSSNAVATSGSNTISCSDCAFTAADVGKIVWVNPALSQTTIAAVNSSTSITTVGATSAPANNQLIIWGSDDTTAFTNTWAAASAACGNVILNAARYLVQAPQFNTTLNAKCSAQFVFYTQPGVVGQGKSNTVIIPTPNFNFTNCGAGDTGTCFLGEQYGICKGFSIWGGGQSPAGGMNKVLVGNNGGFLTDIDLSNWCVGCTGSIGLKMLGSSAASLFGGVEDFGATGIYEGATAGQLFNFVAIFEPTAMEVHDPNLITTGTAFAGIVTVDAGYTWNSRSDWMLSTSSIVINGVANIDSLLFQATQAAPITLNAGGTLRPVNTSFPAIGGVWLNYSPGSTLIDAAGGNTFGGTASVLTISNKQFGAVSVNGVTSTAKVLTNTTQSSLIMAAVEWQANGPTSTGCTDTAGNVYTQQGSTLTTTSSFGLARNFALWFTNGNLVPLASNTVTCTFSSSANFTTLSAAEYVGQYKNGVQSTSPFEGVYPNTGSGTAVTAGTTTSTSLNNELIGLFLTYNTTPSWTNTGVAQTVRAAGGLNFYVLSDGILASAGTYTLTGTFSASADWAGFWFKIKPGVASVVFGSASMLGAPQVLANWAVPAGSSAGQWGTSPSVGSCTGSAVRQECTITVGSGTVGANPILTITQPTSFVVVPSCSAQMVGGTATLANFTNSAATTISTATFTYNGTPGASSTIDLVVNCSN